MWQQRCFYLGLKNSQGNSPSQPGHRRLFVLLRAPGTIQALTTAPNPGKAPFVTGSCVCRGIGASPGSVRGRLLDNVLARGKDHKQSLGSTGNWLPASKPCSVCVCDLCQACLTCLWQPSTMISFCWGDVRAKTISACSRRIASSCSELMSFSSIPFTTAAVASLQEPQAGQGEFSGWKGGNGAAGWRGSGKLS